MKTNCPTCDDGICTQGCAKGLIQKPRAALQVFNPTAVLLMVQYGGPVIALKRVHEIFGFNTPEAATKAANAGDIPVPLFKVRNSNKAPYMIHIEDLANYIDAQRSNAAKERAGWSKAA